MMHVTRNTVINWEADKSKPDYNLIPEVCSLLNIQIHELFHMQAENGLSDLEDRVVGNIRLLSPTSRRVIDKMISTMVEEKSLTGLLPCPPISALCCRPHILRMERLMRLAVFRAIGDELRTARMTARCFASIRHSSPPSFSRFTKYS